MGPQSRGSPNCGNFETPTWESWNKRPFGCGPMESCKVYYKAEGGDFPQVQATVSLVSPSCLWFVLGLKVLQLCSNHFVLVLCRFVWVVEACQLYTQTSNECDLVWPLKFKQKWNLTIRVLKMLDMHFDLVLRFLFTIKV